MTDQTLINSAIYSLLENGDADANLTFATSMYTTTQLINALNDRQRRMLKDTGCVLKRNGNIGGTPQTSRYVLPTDWMETRRASWSTTTTKTFALMRSDAYELDHGLASWEYGAGLPFAYQEGTLPTLEIEVAPTPNDIGHLGILYTALPTTLDGTGKSMTVPDELSPAVKWAAIGDLLSQDGEGADPQRAEYCSMRYDLAVEMCNLLIEGSNG